MAKLNKKQKDLLTDIRKLLSRIPTINNPMAQTELVWCNKMFESIKNELRDFIYDFIWYCDDDNVSFEYLKNQIDKMNKNLNSILANYNKIRLNNKNLKYFRRRNIWQSLNH